MSGASARHCDIVSNLVVTLSNRLKGRPCKATAGDLRLRVAPTGLFTYPDVIVTCGQRKFADPKPDTLTNPTVVIEVLSDSTRDYHLGRKFHHYRTNESLREYITVDQDTPHVEHHVRQPDNTWVLTDYSDLTATLTLPSLDCTLTLAEIYEEIEFTA